MRKNTRKTGRNTMKKLMQNIKDHYKLLIGVFIVGLLFGWIFFHSSGKVTETSRELSGDEHQHAETENQIWTCSMHPQIKMDRAGKCPICGMDLIPLTSMSSSAEGFDPNEIVMTEEAAKLASIQTMKVAKGVPDKAVYLNGKIQADERRIAELTARFGGRIEKLFVNFTGQNVAKGEKLATLYSPGLVTAQRELLEALSFKESRPSLYAAAKGKLKLWDLTDEQISAIEEKGEPLLYFDILSPISGTVTKRHVALGDYIKEGMALFKVVDLTKVWALFDAYESDLPWIKLGDKIDFTVQAIPGKTFSAKVSYIDPFINSITRVAKVRVEVSNPQLILKPEMFSAGVLQSKIVVESHRIIVPKSSILWTGKRAVVYVKVQNRETPSFLYREVVLGPEAGAFYVISEGLEEGEEIAVNGVFKIDAASQLQGLPSMMNPEGGAGSIPHDHSQMDMGAGEKVEPVETNPQFRVQLTQVYKSYLVMKDAFVASDAAMVGESAKTVSSSISAVDMGLLKGEPHMQWMRQLKILENSIKAIINFADIEKQRSEFAIFNLAFYESIKTFGLSNVTAYYQFCPMALDNKGAYWFSDSEEIRNPYFGDMMLECGEVVETIK